MKVLVVPGFELTTHPLKVRILHKDLIGLDTECAWRGGQNVNMDLLDVAHARVRFGFGSAGGKSLVLR